MMIVVSMHANAPRCCFGGPCDDDRTVIDIRDGWTLYETLKRAELPGDVEEYVY